ncbi:MULTISPECIES: hypothetical protein [Streptomyces]|uniref:hypothetical protein n=1 Tax=Streptomyces TaxID=1883 RepID=UPI001E64CD64|nr:MULTISPECIES: hypothetical protein [Streptomyces]UFQ16460.1 hypothetical protein J2N69_16405 [Streptomyces huasconensis]WCL86062.1 hypothetical protein PPN52_16415 [Streptomyces sp. JCM 35825]
MHDRAAHAEQKPAPITAPHPATETANGNEVPREVAGSVDHNAASAHEMHGGEPDSGNPPPKKPSKQQRNSDRPRRGVAGDKECTPKPKGGEDAEESDEPKKPKKPEAEKEKKEEKKKSLIGDSVDKLIPGSSKYLPDWAKPIVFDVKKKSVDPDAVDAFLAQDGTLVVHAILDPAKQKDSGGLLGVFAAFTDEPAAQDGIEVLLTVEDPSTASASNPTTVQTIVVAPDAPEPVTKTAEVYSAEQVDKVAETTVDQTVKEATEEAASAA